MYKILDRKFPQQGVDIRIEQNKQIESTSDLYVIPLDQTECCHVIENEGRSEKNIQHYDNLKTSPDLPESARPRWLSVFQLWLMRNLELDNLKQIEEMLTEHLPAVEETVWGKELIEKYEEKGREEGREDGAKALEAEIKHYERLKDDGVLSEEAYQLLVESARERLAELKSNQE